MDHFCHFFYLVHDLDVLFIIFIFFKEGYFSTFFSHLQDIESVLFFNLHHGSSQLDSFIKVFEDLFFDGPDILFLIDSAAISADSIIGGSWILPMPALYSRQLIPVLDVLSVFEASVLA